MIDNYDSFTYNLYQYIGELYEDIVVVRNDEVSAEDIEKFENLQGIVISPGPGVPEDSGICIEVIKKYGKRYTYFRNMSWPSSHSRGLWRRCSQGKRNTTR